MLRSVVPALAALLVSVPALACGPYGALQTEPAPVVQPVVGEDPVPAVEADPQPVAPAPLVEIAILLDTSNSMDGLIDQARARLWTIVNDLAKTTKDGRIPDLRVALYEYGNSGLAKEGHYIRQVLPLTHDLDAVSESLFNLTTNGGDEYCGAVIGEAVEDLAWSDGDHYRAIFIAGNEPFTQGPVAYTETCKAAVTQGVVVNTIHCGSADEARSGMWQHAASIADGESLNIDQNKTELAIDAPQDERIRELNQQLNATYLAFGRGGKDKLARQRAQDANAAGMAAGAFGDRAAAKASPHYKNSDWDLVDAVEEGEVELDEVAAEALPEPMREMDAAERKAFLEENAAKRKTIQAELRKLVADREAFVAAERAKLGDEQTDGFGEAVRGMLKEQLSERGYTTGE